MTLNPRDNTICYIARARLPTTSYPTGTVVGAIVDDGKAGCSAAVGGWISDGHVIERAPVWWCRLHLFSTARYREGDLPG
jgi:hypothetical protein